ncbi:MAG: endo-1,4-beta-xylanase [Verrucomicrobiota bacterium]
MKLVPVLFVALCGQTAFADSPQTLVEAVAGRFDIGVGIGLKPFQDPENRELVIRHFNYVTPENCMKFASTQPAEGEFRFQKPDAFVQLAQENDLKVLGHCLIWAKDDRTPEWFYREGEKEVSPEVLMARMKTHIRTVVERYRGRVHSWDVVNEAIGTQSDEYLRDSVWANLLNDDFIVEAFRYTRELDPESVLIYNDYNLHEPWRRERMERLVRKLQAANAPIDAIGIQGHFNLNQVPFEELEQLLILLRSLNMKIAISELDIDVIPRGIWWADGGKNREEVAKINPYPEGPPPEILAQQAEDYAKLFRLFLKYEDVILRVSFWNIHDGESWLNHFPWERVNHPLLFDRNREAKPAFDAVMKVLREGS